MEQGYLIPAAFTETEITVVNSRFIASMTAVFDSDEAKAFIQSIRKKYPDATHHVPAYVLGHGETVTAYCSDDGEPSGSSGRPLLAVLQGSGLGDAAIVITRYFGGTKLGIGGLVHAYGDAAKALLAIVPRARRLTTYTVMVVVPYALYERVKLLTAKYQAIIQDEDFAADVTLTIQFLPDMLDPFQSELSDLSRGTIQAEKIAEDPNTIFPVSL